MAGERASKELAGEQLAELVKWYEKENAELSSKLREMKMGKIEQEIEQEIAKIAQIGQPSSEISSSADQYDTKDEEINGLKQIIMSQQIDLDNYKWRVTILEAEKLSKILDCRDLQ